MEKNNLKLYGFEIKSPRELWIERNVECIVIPLFEGERAQYYSHILRGIENSSLKIKGEKVVNGIWFNRFSKMKAFLLRSVMHEIEKNKLHTNLSTFEEYRKKLLQLTEDELSITYLDCN